MLPGPRSDGNREFDISGGGVAGSGVGPGLQNQDGGLVEGAVPGVAFATGVVLARGGGWRGLCGAGRR